MTHDKTNWPKGPWLDELDRLEWRDDLTGLSCLALRQFHGSLCGYVGVYEDHKLGEQTGSNCSQFHWMSSEREADIILRELRCLKSIDVLKANRRGFHNIQEQQFSDDEKGPQNIKEKQFAVNEKRVPEH